MPIEQLISLFNQSAGRSSRSTALQPVGWLLLLVVIMFTGCLKYGAQPWVLITILSFALVVILVYLGVYGYLIATNIDATRSEGFVLQKMQIQQSRTGDDHTGFRSDRPLVGKESNLLTDVTSSAGGETHDA